ncbi:MAG: phosphoglucomutase [marine bacterium B5-7]|nr:MAG: phosphoglucomutase [marine bacterium B5-7]
MGTARISPDIFKAYDIRGIVGDTLTPDTVQDIGRAVGSLARERGNRRIVIGRDGRLSGPEMIQALATGLMEMGLEVIDVGMVPSPVVYFAAEHLSTGAAVAVTGSHNPPQYNGFKIIAGGETLSGEAIQELRRRIEQQDFVNDEADTDSGSRHSEDVTSAYLDRITSDIKLKRPFKICVDCGNGVAGELAPELYRRLGCEVIELFTTIDGTFPNHHPDPIDEKNLVDIKAAVFKHNADFGLAFDGDGDRLGVVSPDGTTIWPDRQMILFARDILKRQPGAEIIYDVKCTRLLARAIEAAGGHAHMYKTGHSLIKAKLKNSDAALAGEMSGHIFFKERWYGFDDGLYAGARLCELLSTFDQSPQAVFDELPTSLITPEIRLELKEGEQHRLVAELVAAAIPDSSVSANHNAFADATIHTIDGLRVDFEDGFALARASNTTPTVIIRFEADNDTAMRRIMTTFRTLFDHVRPGLDLPF